MGSLGDKEQVKEKEHSATCNILVTHSGDCNYFLYIWSEKIQMKYDNSGRKESWGLKDFVVEITSCCRLLFPEADTEVEYRVQDVPKRSKLIKEKVKKDRAEKEVKLWGKPVKSECSQVSIVSESCSSCNQWAEMAWSLSLCPTWLCGMPQVMR